MGVWEALKPNHRHCLGVGKRRKTAKAFCLIDIKEAVPAAAPHAANALTLLIVNGP
jgi:hypothetical protein